MSTIAPHPVTPEPTRTAADTRVRLRHTSARSVDPSIVTLVDPSGWQRTDIVVIPPDTDPPFARSALTSASADDNHRALAILAGRPNTEEN